MEAAIAGLFIVALCVVGGLIPARRADALRELGYAPLA